MIKTIVNSLRKESPPVTRCVGEFSKDDMRARILEVRDANGFVEHWIDVDTWRDGVEWSSLGLLRAEKLAHQLDVLAQAREYLAKLA